MADKPAVARYRQVADYLRERILDGTFSAGQPLPSEQHLADEFGVTRPTIRSAIAEIRAEGLVEVLTGRGMFVRSPHTRPELSRPRGVHRDSSGHYDDIERVRWTSSEPGEWVRTDATLAFAELLSIKIGEPMYTLDVVETADYGRLRQVHRTYVPMSVVAGTPMATSRPPAPPELYQALDMTGQRPHWIEHVRARMPLPDEARALKLPAGAPLLHVLRLTVAQDGRPLALEEVLTPGDTQELTYTFGAQTAPRRPR
jgi:GntR family transcriptional regulator